jgi:hypothetical protein
MNDFELMQYWRAVTHPQREIEQRVLTFGHAVYQLAYQNAREELGHAFYSGIGKGHDDCKPALQKALSAMESAYYILKIQPVTPSQEADTLALAIQSVNDALEKLG